MGVVAGEEAAAGWLRKCWSAAVSIWMSLKKTLAALETAATATATATLSLRAGKAEAEVVAAEVEATAMAAAVSESAAAAAVLVMVAVAKVGVSLLSRVLTRHSHFCWFDAADSKSSGDSASGLKSSCCCLPEGLDHRLAPIQIDGVVNCRRACAP